MTPKGTLVHLLGLLLVTTAASAQSSLHVGSVCRRLQRRIPSTVLYESSPRFEAAAAHYYPTSSETPTCVFEPNTAEELSLGIRIIGTSRVPFAVESGGHATNKGWSSTTGIHISLKRFNHIALADDKQSIEAGVGQSWDPLYELLDGSGVNVLGARLPGVGLGGFLTGGGYSWHANQYGLAIDRVNEYSVVLPNGTITKASAHQNPDLFFGLKGAGNNFGIAYSVNLATVPAPAQVVGGLRLYGEDQLDAVLEATYQLYALGTDPKAQANVGFTSTEGVLGAGLMFVYHGETVPAGVLDLFDAIPHDPALDFIKLQNFSSYVKGNGSPSNDRVFAHTTVSRSYTRRYLGYFLDALRYLRPFQADHSGQQILFNLEGFTPGFLDNSQGGAYPHDSSNALLPTLFNFGFGDSSDDAFWDAAIRNTSDFLVDRALEEDTFQTVLYPNYAIAGTPIEQVWGDNVEELKAIKRRYDPDNIMGAAGGFKVPLH